MFTKRAFEDAKIVATEWERDYFKNIEKECIREIVGYIDHQIEKIRWEIEKCKRMDISDQAKVELENYYLAEINKLKAEMRTNLEEKVKIIEEFIDSL